MLLYQITNAIVYLTEDEINNILQEVDCSEKERKKIGCAINVYRLGGLPLVSEKRHSVLLILDEVSHHTSNRYKLINNSN